MRDVLDGGRPPSLPAAVARQSERYQGAFESERIATHDVIFVAVVVAAWDTFCLSPGFVTLHRLLGSKGTAYLLRRHLRRMIMLSPHLAAGLIARGKVVL